MKYPYFRGLEADRYSFYRVPKALIKVDLFEKMSGDAKLLYAVLLDRMNLSLKNGWQDENGNAYIICTIDEIMDSIRCARQKAVKLLDELEHEYQLIERRRQGLGKPNLLYVKDLYARKKILDYLHPPLIEKPVNQKPSLHQMEHYQKFYENGEYVRAVESTTEQNYNMIDGCANNLPKPRIINGRESVLDKLRIRQMAREKQKSGQMQEQSTDIERNRK